MRLRWVLLCFLSSPLLHASAPDWSIISTENEPSVFVDGKVNAITGKWIPVIEDLVIQGVEPIPLRRTWIGEGRWSMISSLQVQHDKIGKTHYFVLTETSGAEVQYKYTQQKARFNGEDYLCCAPINLSQGYTNTSRGRPSSRTNLHNNRLYVSPKNKTLILRAADGTLRTFDLVRKYGTEYILVSEQLPNSNRLLYDYKNEHTLSSIRSTNPDQSITYAKATFIYEDPKQKNRHFSVLGSDGQSVEYLYHIEKDPKKQTGPLAAVYSSTRPDQFFRYEKRSVKLLAANAPLGRGFDVDYYPPRSGTVNVHGETIALQDTEIELDEEQVFIPDLRYNRIKTLSAPVGNDAARSVTHSFLYNPANRTTTVFDIEDLKTVYHWDENFRLDEVAHYAKDGTLDGVERFAWTSEGALRCKSILDTNRAPLMATTYAYNECSDVVEERLYGNLSGSGVSLCLDASGYPIENGVEHYSRRYRYCDGLLIHLEEDNGKQIDYTYLPGTDLRKSERIFNADETLQTSVWEYDDNNLLIKETRDEGALRFVTEITPKPEAPYLGMPWTIRESYVEKGQQKLLRKRVLTYTSGARLAEQQIFDADEHHRYTLEYKYDGKGRLIKQTNPLGQTEIASFDSCGNQITHTPYSGRVHSTFTYTHMNQLQTATHCGDEELTFEDRYQYDRKLRLIREEKPFGFWACYVYDRYGRLASKEVPQSTTTYRHNFFGDLQEERNPDGYVHTIRYNTYRKPIEIVSPDGGVEKFQYTLDGQLKKQIDPEGVESVYLFDCFGRQHSKTISSQKQLLAEEGATYESMRLHTQVDAEGNCTHYTYAPSGKLSCREFADEKIQWHYDALWRQTVEQRGDLRLVREYDLLDQLTEERKEDVMGIHLQRVQYRYTSAGDLAKKILWIEGETSEEEWKYDSMRRQTQQIDPFGHVTTTSYQATPLLQETRTDPLGLKMVIGYNPLHQVISITLQDPQGSFLRSETQTLDFRGNPLEKETQTFSPASSIHTRWRYDSMGRTTELTEAVGTPEERSTVHRYTHKGQLRETIKPDKVVLTYSYHPLGPIASLHSSDGTVAYKYIHDRLGRQTQAEDLLTHQIGKKRYNPHGQLLEETLASGYTTTATYDPRGRRETFVLPDGSSIQYGHDALYLRTVTRLNSKKAPLYQHRFTCYDLNGALLEEELIGSLGSVQRHYNPAGQLQSILSPYHCHKIDERDLVGNILQAHFDQEQYTYSYDALYQLIQDEAHTYLYDANLCRLAKDEESTPVNALFEPATLLCDHNGNPTQWNQGVCTYDALDRLTQIEWLQSRVTYTYSADHRRLSKQLFSKTPSGWRETQHQYFLYDGQNEIGSIDEQGCIQELRILGLTPQAELGAAIALELQGSVYLPLHDVVGNVRGVVPIADPSEKVIYTYTPFGEEVAGSYVTPWRFSSKRIDPETGLIYYGRRYYAPSLGRWLTPDPAGFTDSLNLYAFVKNNPLLYADLYGLYTDDNAASLHYDAGPSERTAGSTLLERALDSSIDFAWEVVTSPYFHGSMQMLGGYCEASMGMGVMAAASACPLLIPAAPFGAWLAFHGSDQLVAGMRTIANGAFVPTATSQLLQLSGISSGTAELVDGGLSLVGAGLGGAIIQAQRSVMSLSTKALTGLDWTPYSYERTSGNGFLGHKAFELKNPGYQPRRNPPTIIQGRSYSGHALDQMQNRGFIPSVIEETIANSSSSLGKNPGTISYYNHANDVTVILNTDGKVITVSYGEIYQ